MNRQTEANRAPQSQADVAYRKIYDLVLASKGGEEGVWFERQLGEQLGMGRTPVREALKRLQNEGLLIPVSAHGGLGAATIMANEVEDVYRVRAALEALAAEIAANRSASGEVPRSQLTLLRELSELMRERADAGDTAGQSAANHQFHRHISVLAGNAFLTEALDRLWGRIAVSALNNLIDDPKWVTETHHHHDQIVRFIIDGDPSGAAQMMTEHIERARDVYLTNHGAAEAERV